ANVRTTGVEGGVRLNYRDFVQLDGNVTYQDLTDRTRFDEGLPNTNFGSRVPNVPYLFGNVRLALTPSPATATNRVRLYATVQSVRSFYLTWEALGDPDEKNVIPGHTTLDLEAEYEIMDGRLNLSATIRNVTDARVYDNFNIQKPGRAIHVKTRFFLE
ncbi:MAG: TonB-dependent receptor, partial [Longimicrobiales bacterium]|nr:TonB-dependent receptor [Longimicrobiales bacterium]